MRIAFLTTEFPVGGRRHGGLGSYLGRVAPALAARGHEVHVVLLGVHRKVLEWRGVRVHVVTARGLPEGQVYSGARGAPGCGERARRILMRACLWHSTPVEALRRAAVALFHVSRLHRRHRFDIVQAPNIAGMGMLCAALLPCPVVVRASGFAPLWNRLMGARRTPAARFLEWMEAESFRRARGGYAPSDFVAGAIRDAVPAAAVTTVRPPFVPDESREDDAQFRALAGGAPYVLFFGRIADKKGAHVLGAALAKAMLNLPDMRAFFIGRDAAMTGGGSTAARIRRLCAAMCQRVNVAGEMPQGQLRPFVCNARLVILPSLVDNLPNACIEAMGAGKAVIGTIGTSLDELIEDGISGFLVEPDDADGLARCIEQAWRRDDLDAIGEAAAERIRTLLDPERTLDALERFYCDCIRKATK